MQIRLRHMPFVRPATLFCWACLAILPATRAEAQPRPDGAASTVASEPQRSAAFGARIIDLAVTLDAAATQSLVNAPSKPVPATLTFTDDRGSTTSYHVDVHIKGQYGSARTLDGKPALKITLSGADRFFGLEHLTLNNMVQDPTMLHEVTGYQVYQAAGVQVPSAGYARVTINGEPYGLYANIETIDLGFLERRFGDNSGVLYEGAYRMDLRDADVDKFERHEGQDPARAALHEFVRALDGPADDMFYGSSPKVDTRSFLAMMAAAVLLNDWDNYYTANNYRIYWNPSAGRWFFVPTGIDQTFGTKRPTTIFGGNGLLFQKCLTSERCTKDYVAAVRETADRFERLDLQAKVADLLTVIEAASQTDPRREYSRTTMAQAREEMRAFIANRPNEVRAALSCLVRGGTPNAETAAASCAGSDAPR